MDFKVVESQGILFPVFEGETPEAWLRAAFLRDLRSDIPNALELISQVKEGARQPAKTGGDEVWVEFYPDRAVITAQWIRDKQGDEMTIQIPIDEAEHLLRIWQMGLAKNRK